MDGKGMTKKFQAEMSVKPANILKYFFTKVSNENNANKQHGICELPKVQNLWQTTMIEAEYFTNAWEWQTKFGLWDINLKKIIKNQNSK